MDELLAKLDELLSPAIRDRLDARSATHPGRTVEPSIRVRDPSCASEFASLETHFGSGRPQGDLLPSQPQGHHRAGAALQVQAHRSIALAIGKAGDFGVGLSK